MRAVDCNIIKPNSNELQSDRASAAESSDSPIHKKYTRHSSVNSTDEKEQCFFCGEPAKDTQSFHHASTFGLDARVRECALQLQDQNLLAKLCTGDLIAQEAKYHIQCLVSLYNRARQSKGSTEQDDTSAINQGIPLAELVAYIEDTRADSEYAPIFQTGRPC